jgi:hypothetical protein
VLASALLNKHEAGKPNRRASPPMSPSETEWQILDLLLAAGYPLPVADVVAAIGSPIAAADALDTLHAVGLADRAGALVFVTQAPANASHNKRSAITGAQRHLCDAIETQDPRGSGRRRYGQT